MWIEYCYCAGVGGSIEFQQQSCDAAGSQKFLHKGMLADF